MARVYGPSGREVSEEVYTLLTSGDFTITNWTEDKDVDANGAVAVVGDGFGTLIKEMQEAGMLGGSVSA
jgi:hypothetical protein